MRLMFVAGTLLLLSMKEPNGRSDTVAVFSYIVEGRRRSRSQDRQYRFAAPFSGKQGFHFQRVSLAVPPGSGRHAS